MNQSYSDIQISDVVIELGNLEKQIANQISPEIFDYMFLLRPETSQEIKLTSALSLRQLDLLNQYNSASSTYIKSLGIEPEEIKGETFEKFLALSRNIYLIRFIEARKLFAEYSLFAIPSIEAMNLSYNFSGNIEPAMSMEIKIPDSLFTTSEGGLDLDKTITMEEKTNNIKSTLSSFSVFLDLATKSLRDLTNITTRAFLVSMNQNILLELMQIILQILTIEIGKNVYEYIDKGYPPLEGVDNVTSLLKKTTKKTGTELPAMLSHIQKDIENLIDENLQLHIHLEKVILTDLKNEIMELIVHYCSQGQVVPLNFYKLVFQHHADLPEEYERYHHVLNVYLLDDFRNTSRNPNEIYDIDFSRSFKETLFKLVTNGTVNPTLTLEEYIYQI